MLEADVALEVVLPFLERVRERALGMPVTPGLARQAFVRIVHDELIEVMGGQSEGLALNAQPPAVILMAGLQGVGKTTTAAKIGGWRAATTRKSCSQVPMSTVPQPWNSWRDWLDTVY